MKLIRTVASVESSLWSFWRRGSGRNSIISPANGEMCASQQPEDGYSLCVCSTVLRLIEIYS